MKLVNQSILFGVPLGAVAVRTGVLLLLIFLVVGILAGEDDPGGFEFDDFRLSSLVGTMTLAVILLDGGLRTRYESFRVGLWPALSLATVGVLFTAGVTAARLFSTTMLEGLLLGAMVGSTDAAALFPTVTLIELIQPGASAGSVLLGLPATPCNWWSGSCPESACHGAPTGRVRRPS